MKNCLLLLMLALIAAVTSLRADNIEDKIAESFFLPEQIKKYAELLNLTENQKATMLDAYDEAQAKIGELNHRRQSEADKFNEQAKQTHIDAKEIQMQGEKFMDADREVRRAQLALLVLIKNTLIPEQQATLNAIKALDPKIKEAKALGEKWKAEGRSLDKLHGMKEEFESDLQSGKIKEAEALVDGALEILNDRSGK